jgi:hypothetical protein
VAKTTVGVSAETREALRLAQLDMSADAREQLTVNDVLSRLIAAWRRSRPAVAGR